MFVPCPHGPALPLGDVGVGDTWPGLALGVLSCEGCWGAGLPQPDSSAEPGPAVGCGRAAQNNLQFLRFAVGGLGSGGGRDECFSPNSELPGNNAQGARVAT